MRKTLTTSLALMLLASSVGGVALAQDEAAESPAPESTAAAASSPEVNEGVDATMPALSFAEPAWRRVTTDRSPAAREDHTWTIDGDGRYAYLFGGRDSRNDAFDDLWRFDLETDTWKRLRPPGRGPSARFGHSTVWVDGVGLVVFAGQRGTDFFGDLWVYDPDRDRWRLLPARGEAPRKRYGSCAIVGPDGRLWISHGFTFAGRFDDTRAYNFKNERWAGIAPDGRRPGERCLHDCFTSADGNLVLYGGQDDSNTALGDAWLMRNDGSWKKQRDPRAKARRLYAVTEAGPYAYVFAGAGKGGVLDDLWRIDRATLGWERVNVPGAKPGGRSAGTLITDAARGRLLLFGGKANGVKDDLWELVDRSEPTALATDGADADAMDVDPSAEEPPTP